LVTNVSINSATLIYRDYSSGSFSCHVVETVNHSTFHKTESSDPLFSCQTFGGCKGNDNPGFVGEGWLYWKLPINNGQVSSPTSIAIYCTIPGKGSLIFGYSFNLAVSQSVPFLKRRQLPAR
jgi:hypothetical protein